MATSTKNSSSTPTWKDKEIATDPMPNRMHLQYYAPSIVDDKVIVSPPSDVVNLGLDKWKDCVVGYFLDRLSYVASAVGRPLYADQMTEGCKRLNYAKVCVEVDVNSELPDSFEVALEDGTRYTIKVWYLWKPFKCDKCKVFGHKTCHEVVRKSTPVQQNQVWMVKDGAKAVEEGSKPVGNGVHLVLDTAGPIEGMADMVVHSINNEGDILHYKEELVKDASSLDQLRVQSGAGAGGSGSVQVGIIDNARNKFAILQDASGLLEDEPTILPSFEEFDAGLVQDMVAEDLVPERGKSNSKGNSGKVAGKAKGGKNKR
ncbi:hypothetical protein RHMOL_Rhmol10G0235200 [Rhododendron molle]|uniref:Uncharacterized protein n=1 Tax=Rhododendron molle TaxID=49168 RepID=A0ACC0M5E9_RHOML|nr:hypothetical protein RHMOL_Rhmol10G0235200 [Rhododendron molle]